MNTWWASIPINEKLYWYLAIPFSVLFIIQIGALLLGIGENGFDFEDVGIGDVDSSGFDFDGDGMRVPLGKRIINLRNIIYFFAIFSWCGILFTKSGKGVVVTFILSLLLASLVVAILVIILSLLMKATANGLMDKNNAIGQKGKVYLKIPKKGEGVGCIHLIVQGSFRELEAVSVDDEIITGEEVEVIGVQEDGVLQVKKILALKGE
ncbi:hypothetical protein [Oceanirhabdus sp. W0125-5]|uniref:hypothetical protein n=1 Tax=Oceanirhabdus sp. W0125-5 TaxID=2999116 RepID=UPI0022F3228D|nr:hypothetical protein [Oceanirhabdus sp. W0125-5]WBW97539.1 hypothetical protein OW730_01620 [Oceanirhabdus sp. W0125-5]